MTTMMLTKTKLASYLNVLKTSLSNQRLLKSKYFQFLLTILQVSLSSSSSKWWPGPEFVFTGGSWGNLLYCWNLRSNPIPKMMKIILNFAGLCEIVWNCVKLFQPGKLSRRKLFCLFFPAEEFLSLVALELVFCFCWCVISRYNCFLFNPNLCLTKHCYKKQSL